MVMPGLVNIHSHPSSEPMNKGLIDEIGSPGFYNSSLYEYLPIFRADAEAVPHCVRVALSELLLSGVTTLADLSMAHPGWLDLLAEAGMRVCIAPMFRSGAVVHEERPYGGIRLGRGGRREGHGGGAVADRARRAASVGAAVRHGGAGADRHLHRGAAARVVQPRRRRAACRGRSMRRSRSSSSTRSPAGMAIRRSAGWIISGCCRSGRIIGHGIFLDDHPSTRWHTETDVKRLAETGTTVAHCPTVFARRGITLKDFGRYRRAGVNMGVGTDTYPHNMLDEMRLVAYLARTQAGQSAHAEFSTDLFEAATIGGARALGRDDIGRLAPGCRADLVLVDMTHPMMRPSHDPVRSLIYAAGRSRGADGVRGWRAVVDDGRVLTMDYPAAAAALHEAQKRIKANVPGLTGTTGTAEQISPPTFRTA